MTQDHLPSGPEENSTTMSFEGNVKQAGWRDFVSRHIPRPARRGWWVMIIIALSVLSAGALLFLPLRLQMALILSFPAAIGAIYVLLNPVAGVFFYYFIEFFRPQSFIPALEPLKVGLITVLITLLAFVIKLVITNKRMVWDNFNWPYLVFVGIVGSTVITATNNRSAYIIFEIMLIGFLIYIVAVNLIDTRKKLNFLIWMVLLIHAYFALKGIRSGGRVNTTLMGDENDYALAMNSVLPLAFFLFLRAVGGFKKFAALGIMILLVLAVVASMSRGGWLGLVAALGYCIVRSRRIILGLSVCIVLVVAAGLFAPDKYWDEIRSISDTRESTAQTRLDYWRAAFEMYKAYPITGVGAYNGPRRMPEFYRGSRDPATQWGRTFHGTLPQILAELGTLGIVTYLVLFYLAFKYLNRIRKRAHEVMDHMSAAWADGLMGGIVGYFVSANFLSTAYYPQIWTLFALTIILKHVFEGGMK